MTTDICRLFDKKCTLRESHIWPNFTIDYIRETGSQYLRNLNNPNKREQDGLKVYLLSDEAEQLFSKKEKWFSEKIFIPFLKNNVTSFQYDSNLYYFGISFLWRSLIMHLDFKPELQNEWWYPTLKKVNGEWINYLTNQIIPKNYNNLQLMFTDRIKESNIHADGIDFYITRALDITIITSDDKKYLAVYGKFLRFIFWSIIKTDEDKNNNVETTINEISGNISFPQIINDKYLLSFLTNRTNKIEELPKASERQLELISKERNKENGAFWKTDAGKSILNDLFKLNKKNSG